jgi:hypothetical protein
MPSRDLTTLHSIIKQMQRRDEIYRPTRAFVHSIDGDRIDIQFPGSPGVIRHVEVIGNVEHVRRGQSVALRWEHDRPQAIVPVPAGSDIHAFRESIPVDGTSVIWGDQGLTVAPQGIDLGHLNFDPLLGGGDEYDLTFSAEYAPPSENEGNYVLRGGRVGGQIIHGGSLGTTDHNLILRSNVVGDGRIYIDDYTEIQNVAEFNSTAYFDFLVYAREVDMAVMETTSTVRRAYNWVDGGGTPFAFIDARRSDYTMRFSVDAVGVQLTLDTDSMTLGAGVGLDVSSWVGTSEYIQFDALDSDNVPATPSVGFGRLFMKDSDNHIYFKNEDSDEWDLTSAGDTGLWVDEGAWTRLIGDTDNVMIGGDSDTAALGKLHVRGSLVLDGGATSLSDSDIPAGNTGFWVASGVTPGGTVPHVDADDFVYKVPHFGGFTIMGGEDTDWVQLRLGGGATNWMQLILMGSGSGLLGAYANLALAVNGVQQVYLDTDIVVFNESGVNMDVRMEGDTDVNLFFLDAALNFIGIGTNAPDGKLHIWTGSAGAVTAHASADELVVEGSSGATGISILSTSVASLYFGIGTDNDAGYIDYGTTTNEMRIGSLTTYINVAPAKIDFLPSGGQSASVDSDDFIFNVPLRLQERAEPSTPAAGSVLVYADTDKEIKAKGSDSDVVSLVTRYVAQLASGYSTAVFDTNTRYFAVGGTINTTPETSPNGHPFIFSRPGTIQEVVLSWWLVDGGTQGSSDNIACYLWLNDTDQISIGNLQPNLAIAGGIPATVTATLDQDVVAGDYIYVELDMPAAWGTPPQYGSFACMVTIRDGP